MHKLITAYAANPTDENAKRLAAYLNKHPMAECVASNEDRDQIGNAKIQSEKARIRSVTITTRA